MRIKRMAIILSIFVVLACLPFVRDMLMGYRVVDKLQNYYQPSNDMAYISYTCLIILFCILLYPIVYKKSASAISSANINGLTIKRLSIKIEIEKNGLDSKVYIRRIK